MTVQNAPNQHELAENCRRTIESFASARDAHAAADLVALCQYPAGPVIDWLGEAVLVLARGSGPGALAGVVSRRIPEPQMVAFTVQALQAGDGDLMAEIIDAGRARVDDDAARGWPHPLEIVAHLAATAAALLEARVDDVGSVL